MMMSVVIDWARARGPGRAGPERLRVVAVEVLKITIWRLAA
jgi:hypothetical protein